MSPQRKTLASYGKHGDRVRVLVDKKRDRVEVKYRDPDGIPRKKVFASNPEGRAEAIAWGQSYHSERARILEERKSPARRAPITHRELWAAYTASPAFTEDLREKSRINYVGRWKKWEAFITPDALVDNTTLHDVDRFRTACDQAGIVINSVRGILNIVRTVYNWGQSRDLVITNKLALYRWKSPKDAVVLEPGEFTTPQYEGMLRTLDPMKRKEWRAWVCLMLLGHTGQRWNAVSHLQVTDFDFAADEIIWNPQYQKQGKALRRPISWAVYSAYLVAMHWREIELTERVGARIRGKRGFEHDASVKDLRIETPWLLFATGDKTKSYTYQAFHHHLLKAEKAVGIVHEKYRAGHGLRRMVVGNIGEETGDRMLGLEYVGDKDPKMLKSYDKREGERMRRAAASMEDTK